MEGVAAHMRDAFELHGAGAFALAPEHFGGRSPEQTLEAVLGPGAGGGAAEGGAPPLAAARGASSAAGGSDEEEEEDCAGGGEEAGPSAASAGGGAAEDAEPSGDEGPGGATPEELQVRRERLAWWRAGWLGANPLGVPTEREVATLGAGGAVYRVLLVRTAAPPSAAQ